MRPTSGYTPKNYSIFNKAPTPKAAAERHPQPDVPKEEEGKEEAPATPQKKQPAEDEAADRVDPLADSPSRARPNFYKRISPQKKPLSEMGDDEF